MKKSLSVILASLLMMCMLVGCGSSTDSSSSSETTSEQSSSETVSSQTTSDSSDENSESSTPSSDTAGEKYTVSMIIALPAATPSEDALNEVINAFNAITEEKINMDIDLTPLPFSAYDQQINLILSSGADIDLFTAVASYCPAWISSGYLYDLSTILDEYGPDIKATYTNDELATVCNMNGFLYGLPVHKEIAMQQTVFFRTDILEKDNIDVSNIQSIADIDKIYETVAALEPGMWMVSPERGGNPKTFTFDPLAQYGIGVIDPSTNTTVVDMYASDEFKEWCDYLYKWYSNGWINQGAASDTESYYSYISSGQAFSFFSDYGHPLSESDQESNCSGTDLTMVTFGDPFCTTTSSAVFCYSMGAGCKEPEKSMTMLNEIMTNTDLMNILNWGVEGEDYIVNSEGLLDFPEGKDASTVGYHLDAGWILPNQFVCTPWCTRGKDIYQKIIDYNSTATISQALGFVYDPSSVTDVYASLANLQDQYFYALDCGAVDPDVYLPEFLQARQDAGIEDVIADVQKQLNDWLAAK